MSAGSQEIRVGSVTVADRAKEASARVTAKREMRILSDKMELGQGVEGR